MRKPEADARCPASVDAAAALAGRARALDVRPAAVALTAFSLVDVSRRSCRPPSATAVAQAVPRVRVDWVEA
jgi:hypothetical protein